MFSILYRNRLYKYLIFKFFSKKLKLANEDVNQYYLFFKEIYPFQKYKTYLFSEKINTEFNKFVDSGELEYLIKFTKGVIIEPKFGYALNFQNEILLFSLPYGGALQSQIPHYIFYKRKKIIKLKKAISIFYNWFNYWHFHNDVLGQLYLLEKENISPSIPILIPSKALELSYVQYFFKTTYAQKWSWIYQHSNEYYKVDEVYFAKSIPNISLHFIFSRNIFHENAVFNIFKNRKIFLTRSESRGRCILNMTELTPVIQKFGFQIVDADVLGYEDQIRLFSEALVICGPHGAGLTNMLFRSSQECTIIELFPEDYISVHYYWLANEFGFKYYAAYGSIQKNNAFSFSSVVLRDLLSKV